MHSDVHRPFDLQLVLSLAVVSSFVSNYASLDPYTLATTRRVTRPGME